MSNAPKEKKLTPSMIQYMKIKEAYPEYLIFYRMGDFYELFFEDAHTASKALDLALTHRQDAPMCGVPFHAYESYLAKLIRLGYKVAICEQTETPEEARKRGRNALVNREVIRLVTQGTLTEDTLLDARKYNYLLACVKQNNTFGFAWLELSTGDFYTMEKPFDLETAGTELQSVINKLDPGEILVADSLLQIPDLFSVLNTCRDKLTSLPQARFNSFNAEKLLEKFFNVNTIESFGAFSRAEISAAGIALDYVQNTQKGQIPRLKHPIKFSTNLFMEIDYATCSSLEILESSAGTKKNSLLGTIDRTLTGAGARLLSYRLGNPSVDIKEINRRLDLIDFFINVPEIRDEVRFCFKHFSDLERIISRLSLKRGGPRELYDLGESLSYVPKIKNIIYNYGRYTKIIDKVPDVLDRLLKRLGDFSVLVHNIENALINMENLPKLARDGNFIREGYHPALDALRNSHKNKTSRLAELEKRYQEKTGITGLKIKYNNVIGYFIEVNSKFVTDLLQNPDFIHRQSVLNGARFTTAELTEIEQEIQGANEKITALEIEIFENFVQDVLCASDDISNCADIIARLDVAAALADLAAEKNYCRPILEDSTVFEIKDGRHPVVEAALERMQESGFVGNDCTLDGSNNRIWLLTGPNMAGKSTFLRQNALIAIMAQAGSYVPCSYAKIGIIDRLFSRVGASDDLARGRSTFMVEMVETASILNRSTPRSFIILDEIGRGTATYDGLSIAWAVVEHLHEINRCRTLFATHYHELTILVSKLKAMSLHCMKIKEFNDEVVFMHEVIAGAADRSYGIHVAKLAGLPDLVIKRAQDILQSLEQNPANRAIASIENDLPLFAVFQKEQQAPKTVSPLDELLKNLNPDDFTPRQALDKLYEIKKLSEKKS